MKILHLDKNHNFLINGLKRSGYINVEAYKMPIVKVKSIIGFNHVSKLLNVAGLSVKTASSDITIWLKEDI